MHRDPYPPALPTDIARRTFLRAGGVSVGAAALGCLQQSAFAGTSTAALPRPTHRPRVRRVIFLCMAGGPTHLETFDYKPELARRDGQPMPASFTQGQPIAQLQGQELKCLGPLVKFRQHGQSGQWISDFLPWHAKMADEICVIRSLRTDQINHDPAHTFMNTGTAISGRPSMGSWVTYGLGSEAQDLPGFVVLTSRGGRSPQPIASRQWAAGFLPSRFQGVEFSATGEPVHYVRNPAGIDADQQRRLIDSVQRLNQHRQQQTHDPELETRIAAYELAFRMQAAVPDLMDMSDEPRHVLDLYGANPGDGSFASNCLLARRLAERGVRFIHLYHRGWDHHDKLTHYMDICTRLTDRATWALVHDLKQRGMLDDTLIVWGGEFGRTPMAQTSKGDVGRDHHMKGFSMWVAGGGIRGGSSYGATDELGYAAAENIVNVRDLHATMLHMLGIDPERFTVKHQGLDMRLTGVEPARVLHEILT